MLYYHTEPEISDPVPPVSESEDWMDELPPEILDQFRLPDWESLKQALKKG